MYTFVLKENCLTDNLLLLSESGKVFKGGIIAIAKEFTFANAWGDRELPNKKFRSKKRLFAFLEKNYPDFEADFEGTEIY